MNTVFKFYLQAWILLAVLAGPSAVLVWRALFRAKPVPAMVAPSAPDQTPATGARQAAVARSSTKSDDDLITPELVAGAWKYVWAGLLLLLALACAVYPILATRTKVGLRFAQIGPGIDGMAYMAEATYRDRERDLDLPSDYRAIRFLMEHVQGTPVILEGYAPLYHWGSRISIYTGLPTVIGWDWHQKQQRSAYGDRVDQRVREVNRFYESPDVEQAWGTIRKYGVALIVVGGLERAYYPAAGLGKFDRMVDNGLEVVYREGGVTIYQVVAP